MARLKLLPFCTSYIIFFGFGVLVVSRLFKVNDLLSLFCESVLYTKVIVVLLTTAFLFMKVVIMLVYVNIIDHLASMISNLNNFCNAISILIQFAPLGDVISKTSQTDEKYTHVDY